MGSEFTTPIEPTLSPRLNNGTFRAFVHDTHHAYLLLHRAFQSIPPTVIPNMVPASPTGHGDLDQPDYLRPAFLPDARDILPSPTDEDEENEIFKTVTGQDLYHIAWPMPTFLRLFDIALHLMLGMYRFQIRLFPSRHSEQSPNLLLLVDVVLLEATLTKPPKPGTFLALVHHRSDLLHAHGPQKIWPNFVN